MEILYNAIYDVFINNNNIDDSTVIIFDNYDLENTDENKALITAKCDTAMTAFMNDFPQVFWVKGYSITRQLANINGVSTIVTTTIVTNKHPEFGDTLPSISEAKSQLLSAIDEYRTLVNNNAANFRFNSSYDKLKLLYETMISNIEYGSNSVYQSSAYGALVQKKCICAGYARGLLLLCQKNGIQCIKVTTVAHGLNFIRFDDNWYFTDPTADKDGGIENLVVGCPNNFIGLNPQCWGNSTYVFGYPEVSDVPYILLGDVDLDNGVTSNDATIVLQYVLNQSAVTLTSRKLLRADIDYDGTITMADYNLIMQNVLTTEFSLDSLVDGEIIELEDRDMDLDLDGDGVFSLNDVAISIYNLNSNSVSRIRNSVEEIKTEIIELCTSD